MSSLLTQARRALLGLTDTEKSLLEHFGSPDHTEVLTQHAQATQAIHAQVAAQPPGPLSTGARPGGAAPATTPDLHCWAKFVPSKVHPPKGYFGFDWMEWTRYAGSASNKQVTTGPHSATRLTAVMGTAVTNFDYCYDKYQQRYLPVAHDTYLTHRLQDEYQRLVIYGEDYFAAWLSLRPGQQITLRLYVEALNMAPVKGNYLTFAAHPNYQVTLNGQVNQAIRFGLDGGDQEVEITIKCLRACTSTALRVLDEKGLLAGQLNVVDNTHTYHLPIRVVYLVKEGPGAATQVKQLQQSFAALNLEKHLNTSVLNQAFIQVQFEKTNQVYQVHFNEAAWADKFYDKAKNWFNDYNEIDNKTKVRTGAQITFLNKVLAEYSAKYERNEPTPYRGILLVLTNIAKNPAYNIAGESNFVPFDYREAIIYGNGTNKKFLYGHEIGHALGLEHSFLNEADSEKNLESYIALLEKGQAASLKLAADYQAELNKDNLLLKKESAFYLKHPLEQKRVENYIQEQATKLAALKKTMAGNDRILTDARLQLAKYRAGTPVSSANPFKFEKYSTKNIMDYSAETDSFFHWQWKVMQQDVLKYYGN
ncbi:MAG: hypothetical protein EOO55_02920 [Hymenobacter sp.]|nr:MAG: hypothetical protein EOO55_02920 [Hymenobacter sp.]